MRAGSGALGWERLPRPRVTATSRAPAAGGVHALRLTTLSHTHTLDSQSRCKCKNIPRSLGRWCRKEPGPPDQSSLARLSANNPFRRSRQYSPQLFRSAHPGSGNLTARVHRGEFSASRNGWQSARSQCSESSAYRGSRSDVPCAARSGKSTSTR